MANASAKRVAAALALVSTFALAGCASGSPDSDTGEPTRLHEKHITLKDGRAVTCVTYKSGYAGGLSCDWATAK